MSADAKHIHSLEVVMSEGRDLLGYHCILCGKAFGFLQCPVCKKPFLKMNHIHRVYCSNPCRWKFNREKAKLREAVRRAEEQERNSPD